MGRESREVRGLSLSTYRAQRWGWDGLSCFPGWQPFLNTGLTSQ